MRVVFLALTFPKIDNTKYMYTGLVTTFHEMGHQVTVIAPAYDKGKIGLQSELGIDVIRVPTLKLFKVGIIQKGIANVLLPYQYKRAIRKTGIELDFDLIITPTPPITLYGVVKWLKRKCGGSVYLILRDIFPQNAVDLGMMTKKNPIYHYFRSMEKKLYSISDHIGCMSGKNVQYLLAHNPEISSTKVHILANWADLLPINQNVACDYFKEENGLKDKFLVVFGGNMGRPQKLENIIELAKACVDMKNICFLIYGFGSEKDNFKAQLEDENLTNIRLEEPVPMKEFLTILRCCDVGLISLNENFTIPNFPSKILSYFNAKLPVLASIDLNTDFGTFLESNNLGLWAEGGKVNELKSKLLEFYHSPELKQQMGENGYRYMQENLSCALAYKTICEEVEPIDAA